MSLAQRPPSAPIARPFPDETFYSLCCRQHRVLSSMDVTSTLLWIFGSASRAITHDIPTSLDSLSEQARDAWGDSKKIVNRTVVPLFLAFQSPDRRRQAVSVMRGVGVGTLKSSLGLHAGRFGADHPLKACVFCMDSDKKACGVAYWHLMHQYPGMILCPVHGCMLSQGTVHRECSRRLSWILPDEENLYTHAVQPPSKEVIGQLKSLGRAINELAALGEQASFDSDLARLTYKNALGRFGKSAIGRADAAISFAEYTSRLQPYPPFTCLPVTAKDAEAYISQMSHKTSVHRHPLKHLTLIGWLFGGLDQFIDAYQRLEESGQHIRPPQTTGALPITKRPSVAECRSPITGAPRPKKMKPLLRSKILERLKDHAQKAEVCSEFDVSISTINRLLRSELGVQHKLVSERKKEELETHKTAFNELVNANPSFTSNQIRVIGSSVYSWLYRNDRDWLLTVTEKLPSGRVGNNCKIEWSERDRELLLKIRSKLESMSITPMNKTRIIKEIPAASKAFKRPKNYPSTYQFLVELVRGQGKLRSQDRVS